ncbi:uncharacterized protein B0T15DRAFT_529766 [Chaetomium strumarium]|uniref:Uncharacterized protein n=1 Tax=Chaetomium strumarium TaxID=1170767 RepID=A0AAJ0M335_9PEZI|nr:hypothetical protein B0T15DRAFT_529766 [Chaetomium strumarium]
MSMLSVSNLPNDIVTLLFWLVQFRPRQAAKTHRAFLTVTRSDISPSEVLPLPLNDQSAKTEDINHTPLTRVRFNYVLSR